MDSGKSEEMKIKVVFGQDIRRWHCPETDRYAALVSFVEKTFQLKEFQIQYEDSENDRITLSDEQDFEDALGCALSQERKSLKLFVTKRNREEDVVEKKESQNESKAQESSETSKQDKDDTWRKMALDFLLDENVKRLLPEFVRDVMRAMRSSTGSQVSLLEVVQAVLQEEKYAPIVGHDFYQSRIQKQMPIWLAQISPFTHLLLSLDEERVVFMVSNALNVMTTSLSAEKEGSRSDQMWNPLSFLMSSFQPNTGASESSPVHRHISCDGCGMSPIRGIRYKCKVCSNYDLCSNCEASHVHDPSHELLKITTPADGRHPMMNLGDLMNGVMGCGGRGGHHGWGGPHGHGHVPFGHCPRNNESKHESGLDAEWLKEKNEEPIYAPANAVSEQTWKVKNTGDKEWGEGVELVFMRGNESLPLVKRIAVPNTKPQEIVEITTMIQSPAVAGRYSAGFRLEKNGQRFGPKLFVDVCTLSENENENETETETGNDNKNENKNEPENKEDNKTSESKSVIVKCTCGVPMIETSPVIAYFESAEVHCDLCGDFCPMSSTIYHCSENNEIHPNGYDLCSNCANSQMQSFEQPQKEKPKDTQKSQEQPPQEESPQKPSQDQKNNEPQKQSNEEEVILLNNDPLSEFEYAEQARSIVEMGFDDIEKIKRLLISKKGNINEVLIALLS